MANSSAGSWNRVWIWKLVQPRRAYSTAIRPDPISPVPLISSGCAADLPARLCGPEGGEQAEVAVAQIRAAIGDASDSVELTVGVEEAIRVDQKVRSAGLMNLAEQSELEVIVVKAVEELEPEATPSRARRPG